MAKQRALGVVEQASPADGSVVRRVLAHLV
jgi:hypothetical protein